MSWEVCQTRRFARVYKKLHDRQAADVDAAVAVVAEDPECGEKKKGGLDHRLTRLGARASRPPCGPEARAPRDCRLGPNDDRRQKGDLAALWVYKFHCQGQLFLLGYTREETVRLISLEAIGPHENFYRDLKRGSA